uniref:CUE domain-containing protein n=1 Tax=Salarias fasciatus TaxID=181472 RepID=A0A672F6N2_SALFA
MACVRVPLDEQQVTEAGPLGKERTLPALHPDRTEQRCFVPYKPPPEDSTPAEVEEFLEHAKFITEDLEWLLALPHDKFWCQVVFDESLQRCLDSYLHHAPRGLDLAAVPSSPAVADMQRSVHRAVFLTFLRMATHKESKENFFTPAVFGEIIYENFLFDIPKILDLCVLFGKGNGQLLHKMIENIFTQQPSYYSDLDETVPTVLHVCISIHFVVPSILLLLSNNVFDYIWVSDKHSSKLSPSLQEDLWKRLSHSCRKMVETSHLLLHHTCLQPILERRENMQTFAEELLQYFTSFLPEKRFLCDYDEQFPIAEDISLLQQALPVIDETRTSYLLQGVESAWDGAGRRRPETAEHGAELESLLSCIRDLLPDLGEGFLLACLHEYNYNSELVINNILEDRLAPSLDQLDRAMPRPVKEELPTVLNSRSNVFDDDEFDVFRRDQVDMSRIWKGRRQGEDAREMLNDKQHVEQQRARYQAYQTVVDEVDLEPGEAAAAYGPDDYEDEYDDTYDMNQVGANDLDGDSLLSRRPFTVPQVLRKGNRAEVEEEGDEEEEEPLQSNANRDQFVQDPAVLRERAEARRAAMQQRKGFRPERQSNVTGRPKGQGQTLETFLDRRKKEANKSRVANHNRRSMADSKRNKGMIPS